MNWTAIGKLVWEAANSPAGIAFIASVVLYLVNKLYAAKPAWQKYQGLLIAGVKHAEKAIDDKTENKGLRRFDEALKFIIKVLTKSEGKLPSKKLVESIKDGISIVHDKVESKLK